MDMNVMSSNNIDISNQNLVPNKKPLLASAKPELEHFKHSLEFSSPPNSSNRLTTCESSNFNHHVVVETDVDKVMHTKDKEEDDESHLPPGVRKKNVHHSISDTSSSSEDEVAEDKDKGHSDSSSSNDSDRSPDHYKIKNKSEVKKLEMKESRDERQNRNSKKVKKSKSSSGSRSPSPKRRKSHGHSYREARSRSKDRHHKSERKYESHKSKSKDKRRSRERGHKHKKHGHERRGSDRERRNSQTRGKRSRSRERQNRSPSPRGAKFQLIKFGDKNFKPGVNFGRPPGSMPLTFREKMRQQLIKVIEGGGDVSQAFTNKDGTSICTQSAGTQQLQTTLNPTAQQMTSLNFPPGLAPAVITAAEAAMQSMLAMQKETTEKTGVVIPKYYNPAAINPMKYAEQVQKRKLLWSKNKETEVISQWHATTLSNDHDDKSKEKFRKLMGIKSEGNNTTGDDASEEVELKQRELFDKLDKEYQYARMTTHTHRGVGLGFGSSSFTAPN